MSITCTPTPVMEKLHAWNFPQRWAEFTRAGTVGGINYRFYDGKVDLQKERGFSNFGVMTYDRKPKLACWELWHLWRDFELKRCDGPGGPAVCAMFRRDCCLTIEAVGVKKMLVSPDFSPHSERTVGVPGLPQSFRWRIDYTTRGGLTMVASGAQPAQREVEEFLARLAGRPTYPFLRELFDAEVVAADGRRDVTALKDMERRDGIVTVCFRKPNGRVYVAAFARRSKGPYVESVDLDVAFTGRVTAVDELTGQATTTPVDVEPLSSGVRLKNVRVPCLPARYSQRLTQPVSMPVFRIDAIP